MQVKPQWMPLYPLIWQELKSVKITSFDWTCKAVKTLVSHRSINCNLCGKWCRVYKISEVGQCGYLVSSLFSCGHVPAPPGDELPSTHIQRACTTLLVTTWLIVVNTESLDARQRNETDRVLCCNVVCMGLQLAM